MNPQAPDNVDPDRPLVGGTPEDLYCLECGYNLRGLTGDPRRCPECGSSSSVAEMRIPARLITRQARKLEAQPVRCITCSFGLVCVGALALSQIVPLALALAAGVLIGVLWRKSLRAFMESCRFQPGWGIVLVELHAAAFLMLPALYALLPFLIVLCFAPSMIWWPYVPAGAGLFVLGMVTYRDARRRLVGLCRRAAVSLASEELAKHQPR